MWLPLSHWFFRHQSLQNGHLQVNIVSIQTSQWYSITISNSTIPATIYVCFEGSRCCTVYWVACIDNPRNGSSHAIPNSFLFSSFSRRNFNHTNRIKCICCTWDSNLGPQYGRRRWNHGATAIYYKNLLKHIRTKRQGLTLFELFWFSYRFSSKVPCTRWT